MEQGISKGTYQSGIFTNLVFFQNLSERLVLCADEALQILDVTTTLDGLPLVFPKHLPSLVGQATLAGAAAHDESIDQAGEMRQSSRDLVGFAGNKEVNAGVLQVQLVVEVVLEALQRMVDLTRNDHGLCLAPGGVQLDLLLQRVVVDVLEAPSWHRCSLKVFAIFHALVV